MEELAVVGYITSSLDDSTEKSAASAVRQGKSRTVSRGQSVEEVSLPSACPSCKRRIVTDITSPARESYTKVRRVVYAATRTVS